VWRREPSCVPLYTTRVVENPIKGQPARLQSVSHKGLRSPPAMYGERWRMSHV
jgi:hypothetical protein